MFLPTLLLEIDICLSYMQGCEINAVVLTVIFLETIFVIILFVNCVTWERMPTTTSFSAENILLKDRFLMILSEPLSSKY